MKPVIGVWIDQMKAVVVFASDDDAVARTVQSGVEGHPHWAGAQDGGGEKKYEERHAQQLQRFLDDVVERLEVPEALYVFGPGETKHELRKRLTREKRFDHVPVHVEPSDRLTEAQIVAKVKELAAGTARAPRSQDGLVRERR